VSPRLLVIVRARAGVPIAHDIAVAVKGDQRLGRGPCSSRSLGQVAAGGVADHGDALGICLEKLWSPLANPAIGILQVLDDGGQPGLWARR